MKTNNSNKFIGLLLITILIPLVLVLPDFIYRTHFIVENNYSFFFRLVIKSLALGLLLGLVLRFILGKDFSDDIKKASFTRTIIAGILVNIGVMIIIGIEMKYLGLF